MKGGLRFQILMLLGGLLLLAFLPLYFAISTYTSVALSRAHGPVSTWIGRRVASQWAEAYSDEAAPTLADELAETPLVAALAVTTLGGERVYSSGDSDALGALEGQSRGAYRVLTAEGPRFRASAVVSQRPLRTGPLNRLLALYMALVALALLVATHFTLTRWIIRPVGDLSLAAGRVATTTRAFNPPRVHSRELSELAESLSVMTQRLLDEERTLRKKVEEIELTSVQLRSAQSQLVHSERLASVGQLAAGFAHEVGNPLAAISGMLDLIAEGQLTRDEEHDFIERMRRETARIHGILGDLLQFARPTGPTEATPRASANVEVAIHETVTLVRPQPLFRNVDLSLDLYPDLPQVQFAHERLTQVMLNLLMNAAHACKDGGLVSVCARQRGALVEVEIRDDGHGVPEELRERIFEPFVSTKDVGEGTGLGLSVCKGLIEAAGGTLLLVATGDGACFRFTLRVDAPESAES